MTFLAVDSDSIQRLLYATKELVMVSRSAKADALESIRRSAEIVTTTRLAISKSDEAIERLKMLGTN